MCRVDIPCRQQAELLATQPGVIGQGQHDPIAERLRPGRLEQMLPLCVGRDPGQGCKAGHKGVWPSASKATTLRLPASPNRMICSKTLLDQVVVEEPYGCQAQPHRGVGHPGPLALSLPAREPVPSVPLLGRAVEQMTFGPRSVDWESVTSRYVPATNLP